jgi:hypothetical protein
MLTYADVCWRMLAYVCTALLSMHCSNEQACTVKCMRCFSSFIGHMTFHAKDAPAFASSVQKIEVATSPPNGVCSIAGAVAGALLQLLPNQRVGGFSI